MKQFMKRFVLVTTAMLVIVAMVSFAGEDIAASAESSFGRVTGDNVRLRKQAGGDGYWFNVSTDFVCEILATTVYKGETWYKVNSTKPESMGGRTYIGYIHGNYFTPLTAEEAALWNKNPVQGAWRDEVIVVPTATPAPQGGNTGSSDIIIIPDVQVQNQSSVTTGATGQITNSGVNFRSAPQGDLLFKVDKGTVVELLEIPTVVDSNHWYKVRYNGQEGYIMSTYIKVISTGTVVENNTQAVVTATPVPQQTAEIDYGKVYMYKSNVNLRSKPDGDVIVVVPMKTTLKVKSPAVKQNGYTWYFVEYGKSSGYVRADVVQYTPGTNAATQAPSAVETLTPTDTPAPASGDYGTAKMYRANMYMRSRPAGDVVTTIPKNTVVSVKAPSVKQNGYTWYYVEYKGAKGYVRGDYVQYTPPKQQPSQPTQSPTYFVTGYVKTTANVNLREKPMGSVIEVIKKNTVVSVVSPVVTSGNSRWYPVLSTSGKIGYVSGDYAKECNAQGGEITAPTITPAPEAAATAVPGSDGAYGYIKVTQAGTNIRKTAGGEMFVQVAKNTIIPLASSKLSSAGGYNWYQVNYGGRAGFVRGDCCFKLSDAQVQAYLAGQGIGGVEATEAPTATEPAIKAIITTGDKLNLRTAPTKDSQAPYQVNRGVVMIYSETRVMGGTEWYHVTYKNTSLWVSGAYVRQLSDAEYQSYIATNPQNTPQSQVILGYIKTTADGINVRSTPNGSKILGRVNKGMVFVVSQQPAVSGKYQWYFIKTDAFSGYIRGDFVKPCEKDGSDIASQQPAEPDGTVATYNTLKLGSKGPEVATMVTKLKELGYFTGSVTNTYTSSVESAVKAFQKANGLKVDGIAGSATLHKLYGTTAYDPNQFSGDYPFFPCEKIDWFSGGIQQLWPKGANVRVYDVNTGKTWVAHRWSGGNHCDAEPLTAADTAVICSIYGVKDAQEIATKNLWQRRPLLVTIGNRTFAASMYGVPHNYPDGDTISTNNFKGQLCIHFTNSKTHDSNKVDTYHTAAIQYAYEHCPAGKK